VTVALYIRGHLLTEFLPARSIEADVKKAVAGNRDKVTLQNHLGNVTFKCIVSTPHNLSELVQIIAKAKRENQSVKAIGGFYAFSLVPRLLRNVNVSFNAFPHRQSCLRDDWVCNQNRSPRGN
jgi:hypothetical protein